MRFVSICIILAFTSFLAGASCYELYCTVTKHKFGIPTYDQINTIQKHPSMVRLYDEDAFVCSGTVISDNYILTAAHCLAQKRKLVIHDLEDNPVPSAKVLDYAVEYRSDLALIEGKFEDFNQAIIDSDTYLVLQNIGMSSLGVPIIACGFPHGGPSFCNQITGLLQFGFGIAASGYLYPGMSGGPVVNTATGHVFAVNSRVMMDSPGVVVMPLINLWHDLGIPTK